MHQTDLLRNNRVRTGDISFAVVLLAGVLAMAYGFFDNIPFMTYAGIFMTAATSWAFIGVSFVRPNRRRLTGD